MQWRGDDGMLTHSLCQLVKVFTYETGARKYGLALVQPFDIPTEPRPEDRELGICRAIIRSRKRSVVIPIRLLIRGAVVIQDTRYAGEYMTPDTLDGDMFLRFMPLFPDRNMETDV